MFMSDTKKLIKSDYHAWCKWKNKNVSIRSFLSFLSYSENRVLVCRRLSYGGGDL